MSDSLRIALAQLQLPGRRRAGQRRARHRRRARRRRAELGADLVLFPELTLSGYPPEDLLFHRGFRRQIEAGTGAGVRAGARTSTCCSASRSTPRRGIYNSAACISDGVVAAHPPQGRAAQLQGLRREALLPARRAADASSSAAASRMGLLVCEDIWEPQAAQLARAAGRGAAARHQRLALRDPQAARARAGGARARRATSACRWST